MIVCHCLGISDRAIRRAIHQGACSRGQVARACLAGRKCGGCAPVIDEILESEHRGDSSSTLSSHGDPLNASR